MRVAVATLFTRALCHNDVRARVNNANATFKQLAHKTETTRGETRGHPWETRCRPNLRAAG